MYNFDQVPDRHGTDSVKWDIQKFRFGVEDLTAFWIADMDFPVADCIVDAMKKRLEHPIYGYTSPPVGYKKELCQWFGQRHGWKPEPEWLIPAQNTVTALTVVLAGVTNPEDKVLVFTPAYDPFFTAVRATGRTLVTVRLEEAGTHYELNYDLFERALQDGVRALIFCNPHNPGGKVWSAAELEKIAALCSAYNVTVLSDDVHCDWAFLPYVYTPIAGFDDAAFRTVLFTAPSKTFNLAGLSACTLIVRDDELRKKAAEALAGMFIKGPNVFALKAMEAAYCPDGEARVWLDEVKAYVAENAAVAIRFLKEHAPGLKVFDVEGTFMLWIDCHSIYADSTALCRILAKEYHISVNDGAPYGEGGSGFIRMNIACTKAALQTGLDALAQWYRSEEKKKGLCEWT